MKKNLTNEDILSICKQENVHYIRLCFTDMLGNTKNVEIPLSMLNKALNGNEMFDGSSIEGFTRIQEADMFLKPDNNTFLILDYEGNEYGKVARLICDVYTPDGHPYSGDPRYILKKNLKELEKYGFKDFNIGVEPECYMFKLVNDEPSLIPSDEGGYFDMAPIDMAENCRRDIVLELEKLGFTVECAHHECGRGQNEIVCTFSNALEAADNLQTYKTVVKLVAKRHGLFASFMPKPIQNMAGNGMHCNCSLEDKDGNNVFYDPNTKNQLSNVCMEWIAGILENARAITAVLNPTINSYKRLVPGYEAPCYISWSDHNRSSLIRIPASRGKGTRTELRSPDAIANPYIAFSLILACGLYGIRNKLSPVAPRYENLYSLTREEREAIGVNNLPENLKDALKEFKRNPVILEALGEEFVTKYYNAKSLEWDEYRAHVSDFEIKKYFKIN